MQEEHIVAYNSRKLQPHNKKNYTTHNLERLVVVYALKQWRHYCLGSRFMQMTDHHSLKWIFTQDNLNMCQRRWMQTLQEYDFEIKYRPEKENVVADALSRKASLLTISIITNPLVSEVREAIMHDEFYTPFFTLLRQESKTPAAEVRKVQGFKLEDECLYFNNRLCILNNDQLKKRILKEAHDNLITGHSGYIKTYMSIKKSFFGPRLKSDVLHHVTQCLTYQRVKAKWVKIARKIHPLDIPQIKWECISVDFIKPLFITSCDERWGLQVYVKPPSTVKPCLWWVARHKKPPTNERI